MPKPKNQPIKLGVDLPGLLKSILKPLFPDPEVAIVELIKNANDALVLRVFKDVRFDPQLAEIKINADAVTGRLSVTDNGVGMSLDELAVLFQTMGSSAKRASDELGSAATKQAADLIGEYNIGFLLNFMVADVVEIVSTQAAAEATTAKVVTQADGYITLSKESRHESVGTTVTLHLTSENRSLLDERRIEDIVHQSCRSIKFPIRLSGKAIPLNISTLPPPPAKQGELQAEEGFESKVSEALQTAGLNFDIQPSIGGVRPDFLVRGPEGRVVVVITRSWLPEHGFVERAMKQSDHFKALTGAEAAFVVLAKAAGSHASQGVVTLEGLIRAIQAQFAKPKSEPSAKPAARDDRTIFAAMPFSADYDDVFFVAMAYAANALGTTCVRVDREEFSGDIVHEIQRLIRTSVAVIVDLSESKPNVLYEAGYAHALRIPVIHICSTPLDALPFDVRNWNTIGYAKGRTFDLRERLAARLRAII